MILMQMKTKKHECSSFLGSIQIAFKDGILMSVRHNLIFSSSVFPVMTRKDFLIIFIEFEIYEIKSIK